MATSGSTKWDKTGDGDGGEVDISFTCEHRTAHTRKIQPNFNDLLNEIREHDLEREKRIYKQKKINKMGSDRKATSNSGKSSESSLNRSHSLPIRRLSSRKRFFIPRKDTVETNYANPKAGTSHSDVNEHDALMSEIRRHGLLREKGLLKMKPPSKAGKISLDRENSLKSNYTSILRGDRPIDRDLDSSNEDSYSENEWEEIPNKSVATGENSDDPSPYNGNLLRLFDDLDLFNDLDLNDNLDDEIFMNLDVLDLDNSRLRNGKDRASPNYPCGPEVNEECLICFEKTKLRNRLCCNFAVCDDCMEKYLTYKVEGGVVKIECINGTCNSYVHHDEILERLPYEMKDKYYRFLFNASKDPNVKTCPRCSKMYNRTESGVIQNYGKYGIKVECADCQFDWCFDCQAPWHANIKCRDFRKGDKLLKAWAREHPYGHQNAHRCPGCKIFIERNGGCDNMVCTECNTSFCYRCGGRFTDLKFFGNHLSRLSPLGCKYNYKPNEPVKRKLVRGSLLGAKLLGGVFLVGLGLAAGAVLVGASVVILPVLGGIKFHRYLQSLREQAGLENVTLVRYRTWPRQEQRERAVHIGIQTGSSQQVDVTVHNPCYPDAPRDDANLNSEITMNTYM